ncbi:MAG: 4'-phosphopantetheinyl transferase family protein [Brevibacterium sp.]|uniref:4'-phosphopantetheinyl transferase superfamily protein n=1 Tax=Brevibacterium aurantiacum TaxID=273384 RepID=A0A2A3WZL7_BREAU|nr:MULTISPECIES: 4'-phosphopantetheinyl transferase superfamily protein [Brevibacterium]MDN5586365.1 4'-phosphopantetheinyl transferase superfamily protein [Brevibacterium sp.]PCC16839.1 hypothetical protein CIK79_00090 [Brevibacterium aurantiacum]TGD36532.1 4'-phosphopantetheinyl transferase superfamily protein [Brevibacterium aurantiacum]
MDERLYSPDGFRALLPVTFAVEETDKDVSESELFPEEKVQVMDAVRSRRREFATVRVCARQALGKLGWPPVSILSGRRREPIWPEGIVGSMTHCDGYRAAAVASKTDAVAVGIDAEINEPLPVEVVDLIMAGHEAQALSILASSDPQIAWGRLLFSIKESIYKAWYPLTASWLDFAQCEVSIGANTFTGRLCVPAPAVNGIDLSCIRGRWTVYREHLLTAALVG